MARKKRVVSPTGIYHWIIRGIHKKTLFHKAKDFQFFRRLVLDYKSSNRLHIYHYCLMSNHAHFLIDTRGGIEPLIKFSSFVLRRYAYYYCKTHYWTGSVFQRGYKSIPVAKESYLMECARYIERNPIKALLALHPENYRYSSFRYYKLDQPDALVTPSPAFLESDSNHEVRKKMYAQYVEADRMSEKDVLKAVKN